MVVYEWFFTCEMSQRIIFTYTDKNNDNFILTFKFYI